VFVSEAQTLSVGARAPTMIGVNYTANVTFDTRSKLYGYTAPSLGIVTGLLLNPGSALTPRFALLPGTGVFDPIDFAFGGRNTFAGVARPGQDTFDLILTGGDSTGTDAAHTVTLAVLFTTVSALTPESGTAHGAASPQSMTPPAILDGSLATTDVDAYSISVPTNKSLVVSYRFADPVLLTLINAANATVINRVAVSGGGSFMVPNSGAAGTYKLIVEPDPQASQATAYTLSFHLF
jgi:hypothetical protein